MSRHPLDASYIRFLLKDSVYHSICDENSKEAEIVARLMPTIVDSFTDGELIDMWKASTGPLAHIKGR